MNIIESSYEAYVETIKKNLHLNKHDWYFKSDNNYRGVLEHVDKGTGDRYLNEIKSRYNSQFIENKKLLLDLCNENDQFGKTQKEHFDEFAICSPTNLRYILHSFLILSHMQENNLNNLNIIEIGGGYGGLCLFINKLSPIFNININSYSIFDLLEASQLQEKYLNELTELKNINFYQLDNFKDLNKDSFLISNYAFSEIPLNIQNTYVEKILKPFVSKGLICWNHIPVYQFINNKLYIDKASRVHSNKIFDNNFKLTNYELSEKHNWIEEIVVTF